MGKPVLIRFLRIVSTTSRSASRDRPTGDPARDHEARSTHATGSAERTAERKRREHRLLPGHVDERCASAEAARDDR